MTQTEEPIKAEEPLGENDFAAWEQAELDKERGVEPEPVAKPAETTDEPETEAEGDEPKAEEEESTEEGTGEKTKESAKELPKGVEKRISKLTAKNRELEAQIEALRLAGARPAEAAVTKPADAQPKGDEFRPKPKQTDFNSYDDYEEAKDKWQAEYSAHLVDKKVAEVIAKREEQERLSKQEQEVAKRRTEWSEMEAKTRESIDDYDEVLAEVKHIAVPDILQAAIFESDLGPKLAYELAKKPEELKRICGLPPVKAVIAVAKFEASISSPPKTPTKTVSAAPPPIKSIGTKPVPVTVDPSDFNAWEKAEQAKERRRR